MIILNLHTLFSALIAIDLINELYYLDLIIFECMNSTIQAEMQSYLPTGRE